MDGFATLVSAVINRAGAGHLSLYRKKSVELPGYYRATKEWDVVVASGQKLVAVIELKSQVSSFGNNFNNRAEEAIGSATDLWTAFRKGAFGVQQEPWLGYMMLLADTPQAHAPVKVSEPHFAVFPEFKEASYARRYQLLCEKLMLERLYRAAAFITSPPAAGRRGVYSEPAPALSFEAFTRSLSAHCSAF